jgi:kynurenine formamidase
MGVHFIEAVQMDELAKDKCYEFCFMAAPTKIKGGTGMFIRPIAIA